MEGSMVNSVIISKSQVHAIQSFSDTNKLISCEDAYKSASQGLKASREDGKLSIDSVEDAVDNFYEEVKSTSGSFLINVILIFFTLLIQMDEYKEINDALFASSALSTVEEDELSAELDALMKDPPVTVTAAKAAPIVTTTTLDTTAKPSPPLSLPNVPATIPIQTQETVKVNQKDDNIMQMEARLASL